MNVSRNRRRAAAAALLMLILPGFGSAQDSNARVDALFRQWDTRTTPGAVVMVLHRGRPVHARGYGMANLEHSVPIDLKSVFDIASVSKQFAAMAVALLEAEGRLSLDDDVRTHLPELHDFGHVITVRHLVHHTSGIRDWPGTLRAAGWDYQDVLSYDQILRMAFQQRELNFAPGSEYAYSNTGYNLLAEIVRRVSGRSFSEFTRDRIFQPLGMQDTHFHDDHNMIVQRRADSYGRAADGTYRHIPNNLTALGSSSLFTTAEDLARWVANFSSPVIGDAKLVTRLHERGVLTSGDTIAYAFGQSLGRYRGLATVSHTGSWAGYRTVLQRFPEHDLAIIILANTSDMNPSALAQRIADIWLGDVAAPAPAAGAPAGAPPARPAAARAADAPAWTPTAAELQQFAGTYASAELMTSWSLDVRDGRLMAAHFRTGAGVLQPVSPDRFRSGLFGEVIFERDAAGRVTGFTANSDRVRGLRFTRQNP